MPALPTASNLDFARLVRPGDTVAVMTGTGEPQTLVRALVEQRHRIGGPFTLLLYTQFSGIVPPEAADVIRLVGFSAIGANRRLVKAGVLDVIPIHLCEIARLIGLGRIPVDVVLMQAAPGRGGEPLSPGVTWDWLPEGLPRARTVIAEVNDRLPWTHYDGPPLEPDVDVRVEASYAIPDVPLAPFGEVERRIARHIADMVPDGAVLQVGFGSIPDAVCAGLTDKRRLGIFTGLVGESIMPLIESGAVTNETKPVDRGKTTTGLLFGTERLYRWADRNPALVMKPLRYTHEPRVMAQLDVFVTLNTALEIDLTGQVNSEVAGSDYIGAVTGLVDYVRGARAAKRGRSIIALPSTAKGGSLSRIVSRIPSGVVTVARSEVDTIVTEHGVAELSGVPFGDRAKRLIAIADPRFRDDLAKAARATQGRA